MPRVRGANNGGFASPVKSVTLALNDDKAEKAQRLQSRQALHSQQLNQMKAAATPQRQRRSMGGELATPENGAGGEHVTPMKRVPILANFEEWMKMATDNKINATNSWNFALIDYFHDMSLLREGDGVNFQKASCTLDGCVKIYTSRVDSVATETGKLLSGLAANKESKKRKGGEEEGEEEEGDEDDEGDDGTRKRGRKKATRSAETTLVNSFDQLRLKKMELEFAVDPLFKKASADFDEGGAKGLLLNHLAIDTTGRIVFDSSDDGEAANLEDSRRDSLDPEGEQDGEKEEEPAVEDNRVDVAALGARFFPDLSKLDEQDVCPSLKTFELGAGDSALNLPFLKAPDNWRDPSPEMEADTAQIDANPNDQTAAFEMGDDLDMGGGADFGLLPDTGFGEGGEAWARDAALHPQMRPYDASADADPHDDDAAAGLVGGFDTHANAYGVTLQHRPESSDQDNILNYFDNAMQKNWAGPEHWKITRIKEASKSSQPPRTRKEKEPFEIDFAAPMSQEMANMLYTTATTNSQISLPKNQWRSKTRNILPDDKHFNSKDLLKLFLKPKAKLGARQQGNTSIVRPPVLPSSNDEVDEAYWAQHDASTPEDAVRGDYDANFFQDDGLPMAGGAFDDEDDGEFADAQEAFTPCADDADAAGPTGPGIDGVAGPLESDGAFGANLIAQSRRMRPEYVQYARVAKKVDMRRLKDEMWRGMGFELSSTDSPAPARPSAPPLAKDETSTLMFTDIMNNLQHVYMRQQIADITTSFGFISLLHLANEKGLVIENVDGWNDLCVKKDSTAVIHEGDL